MEDFESLAGPADLPTPLPSDEGWFRALAETLSAAIFLYRKGRFVYVNPACAALTGYTQTELLEIGPEQLIHPEDWERALQEEQRRRQGPGPHAPFEVRVVHRDGRLRWATLSTSWLELDGHRIGLGTGIDVTARRQAEEALRRRVELEAALSALSHRFIRVAPEALLQCLDQALEELGRLAGAERVHLHLFAEDGGSVTETREWCASHITREDGPLGPEALAQMPWAAEKLKAGDAVMIPSVSGLTEAASAERTFFSAQGVKAVVCVPVQASGRLLAVLGFDAVTQERTWSTEDVEVLSLAAEIFASALERRRADLAARRGREWLHLAQRAGRSIAWEWDPSDDRIQMSSFAAEVFGYPAERLPTSGRDLVRVIPSEDRTHLAEALREALRQGSHFTIEHRLLLPDGEIRWMVVRGQALRGPDRRVDRVIGVSADITSRKQAEEALLAEKERAQVTLASIGDGVIRTDRQGLVDYLNPSAEKLTGYSLADAAGEPLTKIYHVLDETDRRPRRDAVSDCLANGEVIASAERGLLIRRDGSECSVRDSAAPVRDLDGGIVGAVLVFQDISELRGLEREMAYLASHDPLTGLFNRHVFERELAKVLDTARRVGRRHVLCFLDLDEFKVVNDTSGHVAGDELLRQLGALLSGTVREGDVLARLGGDEFGVLLKDCSLHHGRRIASKLLDTIRGFRFNWEGRSFDVGASIGVVPVDDSEGEPSRLMSAADSACYAAKNSGRNRVHVWAPDDSRATNRHSELKWVERLQNALDEGRFTLWEQEIRPLQPNRAPLVELLLRLDDDGEPIPAAQFLPTAERYQLMPAIDRWVIAAALPLIATDPRIELRFSINLSAQSCEDPEFLEYVRERFVACGVAPERVCFEITETAATSRSERVHQIAQTLRGDGCGLAVDDFGAALSSFTSLQNLPLEFVKIDAGLVAPLAYDAVRREMVAAVHRVARILGIWTIGKAVESAAVLEGLRDLGVDYAQGYWVSAPRPVGSATRRLADGTS